MMSKITPKVFMLIRQFDKTGVSGTGHVLNGVIFPNGKTVVNWCTEHAPSSIGIFDSFEEFMAVHVKAHEKNGSRIRWLNWDNKEEL